MPLSLHPDALRIYLRRRALPSTRVEKRHSPTHSALFNMNNNYISFFIVNNRQFLNRGLPVSSSLSLCILIHRRSAHHHRLGARDSRLLGWIRHCSPRLAAREPCLPGRNRHYLRYYFPDRCFQRLQLEQSPQD